MYINLVKVKCLFYNYDHIRGIIPTWVYQTGKKVQLKTTIL